MVSEYNDSSNYKKFNSYSNYQFPEIVNEDCYELNIYSLNFPFLNSFNSNKHIEIIRKIEKLTYLKENWDGFGAIPLTKEVSDKSKIIIENINFNFFENSKFEIKITPYSTLIIDWFDNNNEFSLEIGKNYLGYYCDGDKLVKEVDKIEITTQENIFNAVEQIERDLKKIF